MSGRGRGVGAITAVAAALVATTGLAGCRPGPGGGTGAMTEAEFVAENNRGVGLMERYENAEARSVFLGLLEHETRRDHLDVKTNLAIATLNRQNEGDEAEAMRLLEEVVAADPDHLRAHYCLGLLKLYRGPPADPLPHLERVADADADDPYAAYLVGLCLEQNGRTEEARRWYERCSELDPYLNSANLGMSRVLRRLGDREGSARWLDRFQRMTANPRARTFEFKYRRMGAYGEALAFGEEAPVPPTPPEGPVFLSPEPLPVAADGLVWADRSAADRPPGVTVCDLDGDGRLDLFLPDALLVDAARRNAVLLGDEGEGYRAALDHPLAAVAGVRTALWGDWDNDGATDVYLCRTGPNQLWRQDESGGWSDVTEATGTAGGDLDTVDGALVDADHDGDLDIFCVNADGPNELFNNDRDGTFRPLAVEHGLTGDEGTSRQVLVDDLDGDRDADIIVINGTPPHEVYLNDRLWAYHPAAAADVDGFLDADVVAAVTADTDADGRVEVHALIADGSVGVWRIGASGAWTASAAEAAAGAGSIAPRRIGFADLTGDGRWERLLLGGGGFTYGEDGDPMKVYDSERDVVGWAIVPGDRGPGLLGIPRTGPPRWFAPGPGRHRFAALSFRGKEDTGKSMRSNASGIGTVFAVRVGSRWTRGSTFRVDSGPGQSLVPVLVGLGGAEAIDFVRLTWSDGVYQTELALAAAAGHAIVETQRQLSSCPVLFAFDGERFRFVTDLLGVGGLGYLVAPGEYAPPRPWENVLLPEGVPAPRDGRFAIKLGEPMEEACYLDAVRLVAYDLPAGWHVTLDERMHIAGPPPTGAVRFYREVQPPVRVTNERGEDVTADVLEADLRAPDVGALDDRFIGRLRGEHALTLEFDAPLDAAAGRPMLIADGWVEYPYSQTMFAAWQAGATYDAPTLDARAADGTWVTLLEQFGYPAGMPRQMSVPLPALPPGTTALRLRTNQEIYWDRLVIAYEEACPGARRHPLPLADARLASVGFPRRTTNEQRRPSYDYTRRAPVWDTRHLTGFHTAFGPVTELVAEADDALAIFGPGEEIHVEFKDVLPTPPRHGHRVFVLESDGWCKDLDLYTKDGETIEPVPARMRPSADRDRVHERFNTRYRSGP